MIEALRPAIERRNVMPKMRVVQVTRPGGPFELVERDIPEPQKFWGHNTD